MKWDKLTDVFHTEDILPMWVADMDFQAPQAVNEALIERAKHGIYGYTFTDQHIKDTVKQWLTNRHQWSINTEWLSFSPGVVTSIFLAIKSLTNENDAILIQTPVYTPFFNTIKQQNRRVIENPLLYQDNNYEIDFDDFEQKLKDENVKAFILCSPHNPVGRVWTKDELQEMADICLKHDVVIISDEIHADIIYPDHKHIPIASLSEQVADQTVTCMSPTKTFNLAGLQISYIITKNDRMKGAIDNHLQMLSLQMMNTMGIVALEAAYKHGEKWLNELINTLNDHQNYVINELEKETVLRVVRAEGTYLNWINFQSLNKTDEALNDLMVQEAKVGLNRGIQYGSGGSQFMRINLACPSSLLHEGVQRIIKAVNKVTT